MSDTFIERSICEAIDIIAERKIAEAGFDKTKKVVIDTLIDKATGEYRVKDQDSYYTAYATSSEIFFTKGQEVYVLIPGNDMQRRKTILGGNSVVATNYQDIPPASESYNSVGSNFIIEQLNSFGQIPLCSYKNDIFILYDKDNMAEVPFKDEETGQSINFLDETLVDKYIKQGDGLALSFTVRTALDSLQQGGGSYGMIVEAVVNDDNGNAAVQRYNVSNLDVIGQPFRLISPTKVEHFEHNIDTSKVQYIQRIYLYTYGFPGQEEDKPNDIFFKNIFIGGGLALTKQQLDSYLVHIDYSRNGNQLGGEKNLKEVVLQAQLKIKGRIITKDVQYYWFRKNNTILRGSPKYCDKGGDGWQCLNYKENQTAKEFVPYTKRTFIFTSEQDDGTFSSLGKAMASERSTQILCVARYNGTNFSEKGKVINYNRGEVSIYSYDRKGQDNKTDYYFGNGHPILECKFEKQEGVLYRYNWKVTPARGREYSKENTSDDQYINAYNTLYGTQKQQTLPDGITKNTSSEIGYITKKNKIEKSKQESYIDSLKNNYTQAIEEWKKQEFAERIKDQYYIYFPINSITNYSMVSCTVEKQVEDDWIYVGTGSITLYNKLEVEGMYTLNINNGTQVFQYDNKGNSPLSSQIAKPLQIRPLTFTLLDNEGTQVSYSAIVNNGSVTWLFPKNNTLLTTTEKDDLQNQTGVILTGADKAFAADFYIYRNSKEKDIDRESFSYSIAERYDLKKINNYIRLIVKYRQLTFEAYTNFTFPKDGDPGTNGTDYVARLVPRGGASDRIYISSQSPEVMFNDDGANVSQLDFKLYNNSQQIENIDTSNFGNIWSCPPTVNGDNGGRKGSLNTYLTKGGANNNQWRKPKLLSKTYSPSLVSFEKIKQDKPVNIIRAQFTGEDSLKYFAECLICTEFIVSGNYRLKVKPKTGFNYVVYAEDGTRPQYDNTLPFEIIIEKWEDNFYWMIDDTSRTYTWSVIGNLIIQSSNGNTAIIKPKDNYDGSDLSSAVLVEVKNIGRIHIPIYMIINRYGHSAINEWDGNSIDLGADSGMILAPQVGAGQKNSDNQFTGVLMGTIKTPETKTQSEKNEIGLFGYNNGQRSIFLDAETGNATFGKQGAAQIKIVASSGEGTIQSGDYNSEYKKTTDKNINIQKIYYTEKDGKYTKVVNPKQADIGKYYQLTGAGMKIKFSSTGSGSEKGPYIKYGSNNFYVNSDGHIHAAGGGDIAGWSIDSNKIYKNNTGMSSRVTTVGDIDPSGKRPKKEQTVAFYAGQNLQDDDKQTKQDTSGPVSPNFYVTHSGYLFSKSGQIGGWELGLNSLYHLVRDADNKVQYAVGINAQAVTTTWLNERDKGPEGHAPKAFYVTNNLPGTYNNNETGKDTNYNKQKFFVTHDGYFQAMEGLIGPWHLKDDAIYNNNVGMGTLVVPGSVLEKSFKTVQDKRLEVVKVGGKSAQGVTARFWASTNNGSEYNFLIDRNGVIYARSGKIGGWHIQKDMLWARSDSNEDYGIQILDDGTIQSVYSPASSKTAKYKPKNWSGADISIYSTVTDVPASTKKYQWGDNDDQWEVDNIPAHKSTTSTYEYISWSLPATTVIDATYTEGSGYSISYDGKAVFNDITVNRGYLGNFEVDKGSISNKNGGLVLGADGSLYANSGYIGSIRIDSSGIHGDGFDITNSYARFNGLDFSSGYGLSSGGAGGSGGGGGASGLRGAGFSSGGGGTTLSDGANIGGNAVHNDGLEIGNAYLHGSKLAWSKRSFLLDATLSLTTAAGSNLISSTNQKVKLPNINAGTFHVNLPNYTVSISGTSGDFTCTPAVSSVAVAGNGAYSGTSTSQITVPTVSASSSAAYVTTASLTTHMLQAYLLGASGIANSN